MPLLIALAAAALAGLAGCPGNSPGASYDAGKSGGNRTHYEIFQPSTKNPSDKVIIWDTPSRGKRKFLLDPGTRVKVVKTVDGAKHGQEWDMYFVEAPDGRQGWVPSNWCREMKGP